MTVLSDAPSRASTAEPGPGAKPRPATVIAVGAVLLAGLVLFFWTRSDLWLDEALSVNIARLPLGDLRDALRRDGAPPLYYVLLHVWTALFGSGDVAVRSLSGVCMIGAAVALWFVGRRVAGTAGAWIAVMLVAANPYAIRYATEARMYALEMLLVSWGILAFRRALESPDDRPARAVRRDRRAPAVHAVLGALPPRGGGSCCSSRSRGGARTGTRRAACCSRWCSRAWCSCRGCRRSSTSARTPAPRGAPRQFPGVPLGYTLRDFAGGDQQEGWLLMVLDGRPAAARAVRPRRPTSAGSSSTCTRNPARAGRRSSAARRSSSV